MSHFKYNDILLLPHPVSHTRTPMPRQHRAAQFAPFAAVVGHEAAVAETARLTERRAEPDESVLEELDRAWRCLREHLSERPLVTVTYFRADKQKDGGAYCTAVGAIEKIENTKGYLLMSGGEEIPLFDIVSFDSELLRRVIHGEELL